VLDFAGLVAVVALMMCERAVTTLEYKSLMAVEGEVSLMSVGKTAIRREFALITFILQPWLPAIWLGEGSDFSGVDSFNESLMN
jgi:hypothetical protein